MFSRSCPSLGMDGWSDGSGLPSELPKAGSREEHELVFGMGSGFTHFPLAKEIPWNRSRECQRGSWRGAAASGEGQGDPSNPYSNKEM